MTRRPDLVPDGIERDRAPRAHRRSCAWRGRCRGPSAGSAPRSSTRSTRCPLRCPCPAVVTIHDVSFDRGLMSRRDLLVFRRVVPRAARAAARVLTVSERTKRDLVDLYDLPPDHVVVTPNGVDPAFGPESGAGDETVRAPSPYALAVGAIQERKHQRGGARGRAGGRARARRRRADEGRAPRRRASRGRRAARGLRPHRAARGALPRRRMPRPVVAARGLRAAGGRGDGLGDAGRHRRRPGARRGRRRRRDRRRERSRSPTGSGGRSSERDRLAAAGLERARAFSWEAAAEATVRVYTRGARPMTRVVRDRRLARACSGSSSGCCRCWRRRSTSSSWSPTGRARSPGALPPGVRVARERASAPARRERQPRHGGDERRLGRLREPGRRPGGGRRRGTRRVRRRRRERCGLAGPRTVWPDGRWQPTRRRFPTVQRHDRPPHAAPPPPPAARAAARPLPARRGRDRAGRGRLAARRLPPHATRRCSTSIGGWDEGYRHYVEDIDLSLPRDAGGLGALVRAGGTRDARLGAGDRPAVRCPGTRSGTRAGMARFVRKHPETLGRL